MCVYRIPKLTSEGGGCCFQITPETSQDASPRKGCAARWILMALEVACSDWLGLGHVLILGLRERLAPPEPHKLRTGKGFFLQNFWAKTKRKKSSVHCPAASWTFSSPNLPEAGDWYKLYPSPPPDSSQFTYLLDGTGQIHSSFPRSRTLSKCPSLSENSERN